MANTKFVGFWNKQWQKDHNVPKGFILIKPKEIYINNIRNTFKKLDDMQRSKKEIKELDITIEYHYKKRTIDQNNLMWALYEIEANEVNAGMYGDKEQIVTSTDLYQGDLDSYAPRIEIKVKYDEIAHIKASYKIENIEPVYENENKIDHYNVIAVVTTSHFTTLQMAKWIDRIFNRMAYNGLNCTDSKDIFDYWVKWRQKLNDEKIIIHDEILTQDEYKSLNPICEATGKYIGDQSGQLCHIKARGMGGDNLGQKDFASNWLHLCQEAHIETQHQKGWVHFLKIYPHLKYKIETALRREYDLEDNKEKIKNVFEGEEND